MSEQYTITVPALSPDGKIRYTNVGIKHIAFILNPLSRACEQALPRQANSLPLRHWVGRAFFECLRNRLQLPLGLASKTLPANGIRTRFGMKSISTKGQNALMYATRHKKTGEVAYALNLHFPVGATELVAFAQGSDLPKADDSDDVVFSGSAFSAKHDNRPPAGAT